MPFAGTAWRSGGTLRRTPGNAASRAARILQHTLRTRRRKHRTWRRQTGCCAPCRQRLAGTPVHNPYRARCSVASALGRLLRDRQSNSGRTYRRSRNMLECILRTVDEPFAISLSGGCMQRTLLLTHSANGVRPSRFALLRPQSGDCCVLCSYGSVKCPPVQAQKSCCG